jgi:hypothetical protein
MIISVHGGTRPCFSVYRFKLVEHFLKRKNLILFYLFDARDFVMAKTLKFISVEDINKFLGKNETNLKLLDTFAKIADLFTPHTGPLGLTESAVQTFRSFVAKTKIDYCVALSETINKFNEPLLKVAVNFDVSKINIHSEGPDIGCWFTRQVGEKLYFFWHPNVNLKFSYLHVIHHGKGKDINSKIKIQSTLLSNIFV